jgi:4-amino-4-deoxy-L-arabinose transferase-like glycosyltransferase
LHPKPKGETALCAALFLAAVLARLLFLAGTVDRSLPFSIFYYGDSRIYREFALALIRGDVFDRGIPFHPPAFAYFLSWIIAWVGERPAVMRSVLAVAASSVVPLTYLLGRALWGRAVGLIGASLATFSFGLCVVSVSANAETIYIPLLVAQALLLVNLGDALAVNRRRAAVRLAAASGIVLGLGALTRAEHLGLAVILPAALLIGWPKIPRRNVGVAAAAIAGIGLLVIAPWTIHNHVALTRFNAATPGPAEPLPTWVAVTNMGPIVFALGNAAGADGSFRPEALVAGMGQGRFDFQDRDQVDLYIHGYGRGWSSLVSDPPASVALFGRKLALASDAHALGFGLSNWPGGLAGTRRPVDVFTPDRELWKPVALILLAVGMWVSRPVLRRGAIMWLVGFHIVAVTLATFGYARFFLQAAPLVFLFQAAAIVTAASRLRTPASRRAAALLGAALVVALTVELAVGAFHPRNFRATGSVDPVTGKLVQDSVVKLEPL